MVVCGGGALVIGADTGLVVNACAVWAYSTGRRQRPYLWCWSKDTSRIFHVIQKLALPLFRHWPPLFCPLSLEAYAEETFLLLCLVVYRSNLKC